MIKFFYNLIQFSHIDPRIYELEKDLEFYQFIFWGSIVVIILLGIIIYLQRIALSGYRKGKESKLMPRLLRKDKNIEEEVKEEAPPAAPKVNAVHPKNLPDPGLIYKFSLANENVMEKLITIGQLEGNIITYSTEIIDNHLSIQIRILENKRDKDIYNLPEKIVEEYQLDLRRDGKALIFYEGIEGFKEMGSRERIYVKPGKDEAGELSFESIEAKNPVRFRIGDRLNQDGKFINGYFEFHLFTQDYSVTTKANIPKIEKNFLMRLYKIYPGYDTGSPNADGLYPMVDPFTTGQ